MRGKNKNIISTLELEKLPPQNIEIEKAVLGACLIEQDTIEAIIGIVKPESFYRDEHQKIFRSILNLFDNTRPIDILTVVQDLRKSKELESVGGPAYLSDITSSIASGAHAEFHARIVQQLFIKRELIRISSNITNAAFDESTDLQDVLDFANEELSKASSTNIKKMGKRIGDIAKETVRNIEKVASGEIQKQGIESTSKLDMLTSGWQPGSLIILAARPGMGKTFIALFFARKAANFLNNEFPVVMFSLEMTEMEICERELSQKSGIDTNRIKSANFSEQDWARIELALKEVEEENIIIDDTPALAITEFKAKARIYVKKHGCRLIIIDYLQLMRSPQHKFREQEVSFISSQLKATAKELNVPIIALSQLNRDVEARTDKRPKLSDIRESGAIEQDANLIIFIHRPEYYGILEDSFGNSYKNAIELILAKNRGGMTDIVRMYKNNDWTQFYESDPKSIEGYEQTQIF